jgi:hypothetical protein
MDSDLANNFGLKSVGVALSNHGEVHFDSKLNTT